jgi:hypothetical protein
MRLLLSSTIEYFLFWRVGSSSIDLLSIVYHHGIFAAFNLASSVSIFDIAA